MHDPTQDPERRRVEGRVTDYRDPPLDRFYLNPERDLKLKITPMREPCEVDPSNDPEQRQSVEGGTLVTEKPQRRRKKYTDERPREASCRVCQTVFPVPVLPQGGTKRSQFCSPKCRALSHVRLRKYGWTTEDFTKQFERQNGRCYGCLGTLTVHTAHVDHDHKTEKVRGLLCRSCNQGLGFLKDDPMVLRRLMSYLDYQIDKTTVYVAGSLKSRRVWAVGNRLRAEGYDVMDEWSTPGELADDTWQEYEKQRGRTYAEALKGRSAINIFRFDRSYIDHADIVVGVMPAGKSMMLELGYAAGLGKRTYLLMVGDEPRFEVMPNFATAVVYSVEELVEEMKK